MVAYIWEDVVWEKGEIKVVAYDENGNPADSKTVHTAGKPHHIVLATERSTLSADGKDLAYVSVSVVDRDGNLCPMDNMEISFTVSGNGSFCAAANGDPTCLDLFHSGKMHAFGGKLTAIVRSSDSAGALNVKASAKGLHSATLTIPVVK